MSQRTVFNVEINGKPVQVVEPAHGPLEIFIDGVQGVMVSGPIVKTNFFTRDFVDPAANPPPAELRRVVCRLVCGIDTFMSLAKFFTDQAAEIQRETGFQVLNENGAVLSGERT